MVSDFFSRPCLYKIKEDLSQRFGSSYSFRLDLYEDSRKELVIFTPFCNVYGYDLVVVIFDCGDGRVEISDNGEVFSEFIIFGKSKELERVVGEYQRYLDGRLIRVTNHTEGAENVRGISVFCENAAGYDEIAEKVVSMIQTEIMLYGELKKLLWHDMDSYR